MAIVFALALGWVGTHRFVLGQWQWGLLHIFLFVASMALADGISVELSPWVTLSAFVAYYHAWQWYTTSDEAFAEQFLERVEPDPEPVPGRYLRGETATHPRVLSSRARARLLASAKTAHESFDYQEAARLYEQALDLDLRDGESRVLAARCYTLLEDAPAAYRHLGQAVALRATNLTLVQTDPDFAWLRTQADFAARRAGGFVAEAPAGGRTPPALPGARSDVLADLDRLGQLRERGILNEVEFAREKERLLRG